MQLTINFHDHDTDQNTASTLLIVNVDDSSYHYEQLNGDNNVFLKFVTDIYTEIPLGATLQFDQEEMEHVAFATDTFRLCVPAKITKISSHQFEVEATFESSHYSLKKYTMRDLTYNELTGEFSTPGSMKFNLTETPRGHLERIVANLLWREPDSQWEIGTCIEGTPKVLTFDYTMIWDALTNLAQEFETEFQIVDHTINLMKVEYDKNDPVSLEYGKGKGFKSGVGRANVGDVMPLEVLNVQGTDRNIDFSKYPSHELPADKRSKYLLLPKNVSFQYEDGGAFSFDSGTTWQKWDESNQQWETQTGYTPINAQAYETSADGLTVSIPTEQRKTNQEGNFDATEIYPSRVCTVTDFEFSQDEQPLCDIIDDTIPNGLNFANCVIGGETPSIVFQTGILAGREFSYDAESGYIHSQKKFLIKNEEIDGQIMPEPNTWAPAIGDKFIIFGIQLPNTYICSDSARIGASYDMLRAAVAYLHENKNSKYTFSGELDGIYAKEHWSSIGSRMKIGEYVNFTDPNFQSTSVLIRIIGVKQYLTNPYSPEIEMSNDSIGSTLISEMRKAQAQEVTTEALHQKAIQFSKRSFQDAKNTSDAIQTMVDDLGEEFGEFTQGITPAFVNTFQVLVGSDATQFAFGSITRSSSAVPYNFTKQTLNFSYSAHTVSLTFSNSYLVHFTLGKTAGEVTSNQEYYAWKVTSWTHDMSALDATKTYYLYAKVKISDKGSVGAPPSAYSNNTFEVSENPISMTYATGYYYLLIGILGAEDSNGVRSLAEMYGFTEILPGRITTDKIVSSDGNTYFDLVNNVITGNIQFQAGSDAMTALQNIISNNSTVQASYSRTLEATCTTAGNQQTKIVVCPGLTAAMLADSKTRIKITFTNGAKKFATTGQPKLQFQFKASSGGSVITPTGASSSYVYVKYRGITAYDTPSADPYMPFWNDGQVVEVTFSDITSGNARIKIIDEEIFDTMAALGNVMKGSTRTFGGLLLTETVIAGSGTGQAGMSGSTTGRVAFWAGGSMTAAENFNVPVVIMRDGDCRFGVLRFDKSGVITMPDSNNYSRLTIQKAAVPTPNGELIRNSNSTTASTPSWSTFSYGFGCSKTTSVATINSTYPSSSNISNVHNGMVVHLRTNFTYSNAVSGMMLELSILVGDDEVYLGGTTTTGTSGSFDLLVNEVRFNTNSASAPLRFFLRYTSPSATNVAISGLQYWYYDDASQAKTVLGGDGLSVSRNASECMITREITKNNTKYLKTQIKGWVDIPGVLWVGKVKFTNGSYAVQTALYAAVGSNNNKISVTLKSQTVASGTFKITIGNLQGADCVVHVSPRSASNYSALVSAYGTMSSGSMEVTIYIKNGTATANCDVDLIVYGNNS